MSETEKVLLNEKEITRTELEEKKEQLEENNKNVKVVETSKDNFKIRMYD